MVFHSTINNQKSTIASLLAFRAIVTAASTQHDTLNGCFANQARLAYPSVDAMLQLKKSLFAVSVNVVGNRRTAQCDCFFQYFLDSQIEAPQLFVSQ